MVKYIWKHLESIKGDFIMNFEFKKDDLVVYGKNGICTIEDIKRMNFAGDTDDYYILKPKSNPGSTLYVPKSNEKLVSKLRGLLTKNEIDAILTSCSNEEDISWPNTKNERHELFAGILSECDSKELLKLIRCIYLKKQERKSLGKDLASGDENVLKTAQRLIEEEFSAALNCSAEEVSKYISERLSSKLDK